ncbi:hypothetical protein K3495_g9471 [Podosphaera aphanis]|nr:hypothetical protein K3495_g9471 [Podosphaera aphanis]
MSATHITVPDIESTVYLKDSEIPPELFITMIARRQQEAIGKSRLLICSNSMHGIEEILSSLSTGEDQEFTDTLNAHTRAAILQFGYTSRGMTPPPPTPATCSAPVVCSVPAVLSARAAAPLPPKAPEPRIPLPAKPGPKNNPGTIQQKAASSAQKLKGNPTSVVDKRLFVRLEKDPDWRSLSLCGAQSAVTNCLNCSTDDIKLIQRVKTGFAITAKDDETRQKLLEKADGGMEIFRLEQASNLVALRIATVPVSMKYAYGTVSVTAQMVGDEIVRVTGKAPTQVRPHGTTKSGAKFQN